MESCIFFYILISSENPPPFFLLKMTKNSSCWIAGSYFLFQIFLGI